MSQEINAAALKKLLGDLIHKGVIRTQKEFGAKLGYKPAFTSQLMNGHKMPDDLPNKIYEVFGIVMKDEPKDTAPIPEPGGWRDKYYQSLEKNQGTIETLAQTAIQASQTVMASLTEIEKILDEDETMLDALQQFVVDRFSRIENIPAEELGTELYRIVDIVAASKKKKGRKALVGA